MGAEFRLGNLLDTLVLRAPAVKRDFSPDQRALVQRATQLLRLGLENSDPETLRAAQGLSRALLGPEARAGQAATAERGPEASLGFRRFRDELLGFLAREL